MKGQILPHKKVCQHCNKETESILVFNKMELNIVVDLDTPDEAIALFEDNIRFLKKRRKSKEDAARYIIPTSLD